MSATPGVRPAVAKLPDLESKRAHAEWPFEVGLVPLRDMVVDDTYQRPPHHEFIAHGASTFDETLVGTVDVSVRTNGVYAILDGQQRYFMMLQVGKTACYAAMYKGMTIADEAGFFFRKNKDRKQMKPYYSFRAKMIAGDEDALEITRLVEDQGFVLGPISNEESVIGAIRAVELTYSFSADHRAECLSPTLRTIRESFKGRKGMFDAWVIQGLGRFWQAYTDDEVNDERLAQGLKDIGPQNLIGAARDSMVGKPRSAVGGISMSIAVAQQAVQLHNKALGNVDRRKRLDPKRLF